MSVSPLENVRAVVSCIFQLTVVVTTQRTFDIDTRKELKAFSYYFHSDIIIMQFLIFHP